MKYRFYSFMNYYLSSLQQGLQSGHLISELFCKHAYYGSSNGNPSYEHEILHHWARDDKVMIVCNGGNAKSIKDLHSYFESIQNTVGPLPFANFHEDDDSLNGALTGTCIIVPDYLYDAELSYPRKFDVDQTINVIGEYAHRTYSLEEIEFIKRIRSYGLAK